MSLRRRDNTATGNNGLGKETVLQLVKHQPKQIFLAARTPSKAESAISDIKAAVPDAPVTFLKLDLSSFASIRAAAMVFLSQADRLDILINNAGIAAVPYSKTEDGYDIQFGTNHVGHALLTKLLLPMLLKTAEQPGSDVRVINVSSKGHAFAPKTGIVYDQDALESYGAFTRYGNSKLANILHARELQKRHPSITAAAIHPGVIITGIYDTFKTGWFPGAGLILSAASVIGSYGIIPDLCDVSKGTHSQLWAATAPKETVRTSPYWVPVGVKSAGSNQAQDQKMAEELWKWTEGEFAKHGI